MEMVHSHCAGLDVHKKTLVACWKIEGKKGRPETFNNTTGGVRRLGQKLTGLGVTTLVMESTGVYWKPVWNVFEAEFKNIELVLANAEHVKQVPGRKTDVGDAEWLVDLHSFGLIRGSRVPNREERQHQELLRARRTFTEERSRTVLRVQKLLEGANLKLSSVVSNITGKSGMAVLKAVADGEMDPEVLLGLTDKGLKARPSEILEALEHSADAHQRFMLQLYLGQIESLSRTIRRMDEEVEARMRPFQETVKLIDEVPGISQRNAQEILGYAGPTLEDFPKAGNLASWAGLCPGNSISAGKSTRRKSKKGNSWLKTVLVEAAWAAIRTRDSYFRDLYYRKKATRGAQKAIVAVAHALLVTIYHMVRRGSSYQELGCDFHRQSIRGKILKRRIHELNRLGYQVDYTDTLSSKEQDAA